VKRYTLTTKESCLRKTIMYYYTMNDQAISRAYQQSFPGFGFLGYLPANQPPFTEAWLRHQLRINLPLQGT
jgi:hypothetical protein